ncbi:MAG: hypothetical protein JNJ71_17150 [Rubrivivax sp.]|nr:hypothetical protein [Rubrivivax sp.]
MSARSPDIGTLALKLTLGGLCVVYGAAAVYMGLLRQAPVPEAKWPAAPLQLQGHSVTQRVMAPADNGRKVSRAEVLAWEVTSLSEPSQAFTITAAPVRASSNEHLKLPQLRETSSHFDLKADEPQVPKDGRVDEGLRLQFGRLPAGQLAAQACITPAGVVSSEGEDLAKSVSVQPPATWRSRLDQVLGLAEPIRWECVLVSISLPASAQDRQPLIDHWQLFRREWLRLQPAGVASR